MSKDGMVKATAVYTRALAERARQIHHTSPVATAALGRALAGVSMMGNALKGSGESVTLQIKGDGPLGTILAVSDAEGNVRGYVQDASVELPLRADGKLDVGSAVGHGGTLTVIKRPRAQGALRRHGRPARRRDRRGSGCLLRRVRADPLGLRPRRAGRPRPQRSSPPAAISFSSSPARARIPSPRSRAASTPRPA